MSVKPLLLCSTAAALLAGYATAAIAQTTPAPVVTESAEAAPATEEDTIIVNGLRRSLQSAQTIKRDSDQIIDSVVAEDIGKLPDINVSDSLARITGVQVNRANGEAGQVLIRGLPDFTTTYNGRDIFTAEARRVATQDFPAGGVAALEVFKSSTANLVESGLAGLVNVRSRRPFDFKGLEVAGAVNAIYTDQARKYDWNGNLLVSNRWESGIGEFGALINVAYTSLRYLDSARFDGGFIEQGTLDSPGVFRRARDGERDNPNNIRYPDGVGIFYGQGDRNRPSVNVALQWKPTPELEFYFDGLYQGFRREVSDRQLFVPIFGDGRFTNVVLQPNSTAVQSLTSTGSVRPELFQAATNERTDTYQFAVGGTWTGERVKISGDVAHTDSNFNLSIYSLDTAFNRAPVVNVNFDVPRGDGGVEFDFVDFDTNNPANYVYRGFFDRQLVARGDDIQARVDLEYDTQIDFLPKLYVGGRFVDRNGSFENGQRYQPAAPGVPLTALPVELQIVPRGFRGNDIQPTRTWASALRQSIRSNIEALRNLAGFAAGTPPNNPLETFTANEKSYAAYGQLRYEFELGVPIDGVVGVRGVKTENTLSGFSRVATGTSEIFVPVTANNSYTDYLPSASLRAKLTDELQLRLAFSQTRTRPGFGQLNPALIVDPPSSSGNFRTARGGNADLQPIRSDNYDASLEYYFAPTGSATVGIFRRNVEGFISNFQVFVQDPVFGLLRIERPENSGAGKLEGVEAAFTTFLDFDFVPEWAKGFGVQANFTYITGDRGVPAALGGDITQRLGFEGVSKYTYNLVGIYEKNGISARLAYNYRSTFPNFFDNNGSGGSYAGEFTSGVSRLDFSASYTPVENITFAVDASNLLGQPFRNFRNYSETESFPRDVRYEERVFSVGVRFRL